MVNPLAVEISDTDGNVTDNIEATVATGGGAAAWGAAGGNADVALGATPLSALAGLGDATPSQPAYTGWTSYQYAHNQLVSARVYTSIPSTGGGGAGGEGAPGHELRRDPIRLHRQRFARMDRDARRHDHLGRAGRQRQRAHTWVGTNDSGVTDTNPQGSGGANNLVEVSSSVYDADGDVLSTTKYVDRNAADNRTTAYGYDWRGEQTYVVDPSDAAGVTYTMTTYNNLGEATNTRQYSYLGGDLAGNLAAATAEPPAPLNSANILLSQGTSAYDTLGQVYQTASYIVSDGEPGQIAVTAQTTQAWYDADGNEVALEDPQQNVTTWAYNGLDQVTQSSQGGYSDSNSYDAAGELTKTIDRDGRATTYQYDGVGREVGENWYATADTSGSPTETISYAYNSAGLLQSATDDNLVNSTVSTDSYTYDLAGDVLTDTQAVPGLTPTVTLSDQYTHGNRTQLAATIGGTATSSTTTSTRASSGR